MTHPIPYAERHPYELVRAARAAVGMSLVIAGGISDDEVVWNALMALDRIAHERLYALGVLDEAEDDVTATRTALIERIHLKMQLALALLLADDDPELVRTRLAALANETCTVQSQLYHVLMWEHDERESMKFN